MNEKNDFIVSLLDFIVSLLENIYFIINNLFLMQVSDYDNRTPLHIASSVGDLEAVKLLLWNKADPNALDR